MSKKWSFVAVYNALGAAERELIKDKKIILDKLVGRKVKIAFMRRVPLKLPRSPGIEKSVGILEEVCEDSFIYLRDARLITALEEIQREPGRETIYLCEILIIEEVD